MNIRIQTFGKNSLRRCIPECVVFRLLIAITDDVSVYDVLGKGLKDLEDVCEVVLDKFRTAKEAYGKQEELAT